MMSFLSRAFLLQNWIAKGMAAIPPAVGHNFGKYAAIKKSFYLTSLEGVSGDYLEFGVFTGSSLSAAIECSRKSIVPRDAPIRYFGFDSFAGFGNLNEEEKKHPFFKDDFFKTDVRSVERRLAKLLKEKSRLRLIEGFFENTLQGKKPAEYRINRAAVVLIDCDTYSGAKLVFDFIGPILQEGTVLIIDDFFSFKGSSRLGPHGAFLQFQKEFTSLAFRRVFDYGYGGVAFMAYK